MSIQLSKFNCEKCDMPIKDEKFLKDKNDQPIYFHMLSKEKAVIFCSAVHSSNWTWQLLKVGRAGNLRSSLL